MDRIDTLSQQRFGRWKYLNDNIFVDFNAD